MTKSVSTSVLNLPQSAGCSFVWLPDLISVYKKHRDKCQGSPPGMTDIPQRSVPDRDSAELCPFKLPLLLLQVMQCRQHLFTHVCSDSDTGDFATSQAPLKQSCFTTESKSPPSDSQICALLLDASNALCLSLPSPSCSTHCVAGNHTLAVSESCNLHSP